MNLFYCLCGDPLGLGSLAKWSWMLGQSRQLPDGQKTSTGWEENGLGQGAIIPRVYAQSIWWMDTAECRDDVVWQRKLFSMVTGKRNKSKASPRLGWY